VKKYLRLSYLIEFLLIYSLKDITRFIGANFACNPSLYLEKLINLIKAALMTIKAAGRSPARYF
jgi:hypothetical protein